MQELLRGSAVSYNKSARHNHMTLPMTTFAN